jgi:subtilisin family serine protease
MDEHGHGTHIAGVISGKNGIAPGVSLMILKYFDEMATGEQNLSYTVNAIYYAVHMGAKIINYSGGGILRSREEEDALKWAESHGVLVVAAAGNEGLNSDFFHFYPADYDLPNILSVGAIDRNAQILSLSNFGKSTVDISAPGKNIYSTLHGGIYGFMTGTSQATAFASGVSALLMSQNPEMRKPETLIRHLLTRTQSKPQLRGLSRSEAILDAEMALTPDTPKSRGTVYAAEN